MKISLLCAALVAAVAVTPIAGSAPAASTPRVLAIHFTSDVNPVTQSWLNDKLDQALKDHYDAAVIVLDTPGGDEESMRKIVQKELQLSRAGTPVIVYVSPGGARAASAGVWISEAADVLAMAPETNIGSSTPISGTGANLGSDLRRKIINDAAASLRGLAKTHGRNAAWANKAVKQAANLTAAEALKLNVIDTIAPTLPALLDKIDGWTTVPQHLKLHTAGATIDETKPGFLTRFLSILTDPNVVSLLFLLGIVGIGFEIFHPGIVLPGALGAISMLLALFGLYVLPLSWTGVGLVILGLALLGLDLYVPSHGALTLCGLIALGFGLATMFQNVSGGAERVDRADRRRHVDPRRGLGLRHLEGDRGSPLAGGRRAAGDHRDGGRRPRGRARRHPRRALAREGGSAAPARPARGRRQARRADARGSSALIGCRIAP